MKTIKLESPAKINLALNVTEKLDTGYHALDMVVAKINLCDYITISKRDDEKIVIHSNKASLPLDSDNDAYKAAAIMMREFSLKTGYDITIEKNIPISAGLGGGSSNATTVLLGIRQLEQIDVSVAKLKQLALEIGTDTVLFLFDNLTGITGVGDKVENIPARYDRQLLIIKPKFSVSTARVYQRLQLTGKVDKSSVKLIKAIIENDEPEKYMTNDLETVSIAMHPEIEDIKQQAYQMKAKFAMMSGSGSSVFAIYDQSTDIDKAFEYFKGKCYDVFKTSTKIV